MVYILIYILIYTLNISTAPLIWDSLKPGPETQDLGP